MKKEIDKQAITLNSINFAKPGRTDGSPWAISDFLDMANHPMLKTIERNHQFHKLTPLLKDHKLKDDSITSMEIFWNKIECALLTTLCSIKAIDQYKEISTTTDLKSTLLPKSTHPQYSIALAGYNTYANCIHSFLVTDSTIDRTMSPIAYEALIIHKQSSDGFELLLHIAKSNSPHLGGDATDLNKFVDSLQFQPSETLLEFYHDAIKIHNELEATQETFGHRHRLTFKFCELLYNTAEYRPLLVDARKSLLSIQRRFDYPSLPLPHTIQSIYLSLKHLNATHGSVTPSQSYHNITIANPIVNSGRLNKSDVNNNITSKQQYTVPRCEACGLTRRELIKFAIKCHNGDPSECCLRGPSFIKDKDIRERLLQFNVKRNKTNGNKQLTPPPKASLPSAKVNTAINDTAPQDDIAHEIDDDSIHSSSSNQDFIDFMADFEGELKDPIAHSAHTNINPHDATNHVKFNDVISKLSLEDFVQSSSSTISDLHQDPTSCSKFSALWN